MVAAQRGVKPLEVGVAAGDDSRRLVAAGGLDDVDGVELQEDGGDSGRIQGFIQTPLHHLTHCKYISILLSPLCLFLQRRIIYGSNRIVVCL